MKIYLQYPWKFPDSSYYKSLISFPPKEIYYQNIEKQKNIITNKQFFFFSNFLKKNIRKCANISKLYIPNSHSSPQGDYDVIHCCHCLSNNNKPWVCDIEMMSSFSISEMDNENIKGKIKSILLSKNCKKIMPWSESVKKDILKSYPEIENKVEVVYPAIPESKELKRIKNNKMKIIFIARYFDIKGGLIALEVLERLRSKYDIDGIVVSTVPTKLKKKYHKLKIYDLMSSEKLFKLMEESDLFLYPSSIDTFGFSLLEAMAFGLPIITINTSMTKSRREIVKNGKTGFIFNVDKKLLFNKIEDKEEQVIKKLIENTYKLIKDKKLRKRMSEECIKTIKEGKFSIKERNKKLKMIYKEALI
jgi:glycosyltransferase involved in cell wall biosynthesis